MVVKGIVKTVYPKKEGTYGPSQGIVIKSNGKEGKIWLNDQPEVPKSLVGKEITLEGAERKDDYQGIPQFSVSPNGAWLSDEPTAPTDDWGEPEQADGVGPEPEQRSPAGVSTQEKTKVAIRAALKSDYQFAMETVTAEVQKDYFKPIISMMADVSPSTVRMEVSAMVNTLIIALSQRS